MGFNLAFKGLNSIFWIWDGGAWIGFIWLRIVSEGGLL